MSSRLKLRTAAPSSAQARARSTERSGAPKREQGAEPEIDGAGDSGRFGTTSGGPLCKASVCRTVAARPTLGGSRQREGKGAHSTGARRNAPSAAQQGLQSSSVHPRSCSSATRNRAVLGIVTARATTDAEVRDHAGPDPATRSLRSVARALPPPAHAEHTPRSQGVAARRIPSTSAGSGARSPD
jgi:hypothetical protein